MVDHAMNAPEDVPLGIALSIAAEQFRTGGFGELEVQWESDGPPERRLTVTFRASDHNYAAATAPAMRQEYTRQMLAADIATTEADTSWLGLDMIGDPDARLELGVDPDVEEP